MKLLPLLLAALLSACGGPSSSSPSGQTGWTAVTAGKSYGAVVDPSTGNYSFPIAPNSIHYVVEPCPDLSRAKGLYLKFLVTAAPTTKFLLMQLVNGVDTPVPGSVGLTPVIYIQRQGDNWSATGPYESFRWWATYIPLVPLTPGEHQINAYFNERWTAVETSNSIDNASAFQATLADPGSCGYTWPGQTGYGHGITATGPATFTLEGFGVIR